LGRSEFTAPFESLATNDPKQLETPHAHHPGQRISRADRSIVRGNDSCASKLQLTTGQLCERRAKARLGDLYGDHASRDFLFADTAAVCERQHAIPLGNSLADLSSCLLDLCTQTHDFGAEHRAIESRQHLSSVDPVPTLAHSSTSGWPSICALTIISSHGTMLPKASIAAGHCSERATTVCTVNTFAECSTSDAAVPARFGAAIAMIHATAMRKKAIASGDKRREFLPAIHAPHAPASNLAESLPAASCRQ
jgi:hypothetical protein